MYHELDMKNLIDWVQRAFEMIETNVYFSSFLYSV